MERGRPNGMILYDPEASRVPEQPAGLDAFFEEGDESIPVPSPPSTERDTLLGTRFREGQEKRAPEAPLKARDVFEGRAFLAFVLTYLTYLCVHMDRKTFSAAKPHLHDKGLEEHQLGTMDTAFMVSYGLGLFVNGVLADRRDPKRVLAFGVAGSVLCLVLLALSVDIPGLDANAAWFTGIMVMNGFAQSTGWPASIQIIGDWYHRDAHAKVFGLWGTCCMAGNLAANTMSSALINSGLGVRGLFGVPALITSCVLLALTLFLRTAPETEARVASRAQRSGELSAGTVLTDLRQALAIPGVVATAAMYSCTKAVDAVFFFWLPLYLYLQLGYSKAEAAFLPNFYDFGSFMGVLLAGQLVSIIGNASSGFVVCGFLGLGILVVSLFYHMSELGMASLIAWTVLAGACTSGPGMLFSTVSAHRLGTAAGKSSSVTGIIDGIASVAAGLMQIVVALIYHAWGWSPVANLEQALLMVCMGLVAYGHVDSRITAMAAAEKEKSRQ